MTKINLLKKIFKFLNLNISKYNKNFDEILITLIKNQKPIIFDVGANKGQSIDRFLQIFKDSEIHSFEPLPKLIDHLNKKYNNNKIFINGFALSDKIEEKIIFTNNIGNYGAMASFYKLKDISNFKKDYAKKNLNKLNSIENNKKFESLMISTNTLDKYVESSSISRIDLLKIDTQGFEKEVLKGSINSLEKKIIKNIELELILNDGYEKNFYFSDFDNVLSELGYKLFAISNHGNLIDNPGLNIDLIYTCP